MVDAAIGLVHVEIAVVVEVRQRHAEAREAPARYTESDAARRIDKVGTRVAVERIRLPFQVDDQDIGGAVVIEVRGRHAHAGLGETVLVHGATPQQRLIPKP